MTIFSVLIAVAVIALLVVRRSRPRPVADQGLRTPLVLAVVGLFLLRDTPLDAPDVAFLVLTACVALGLGAARGAVVRLHDGGRQTSWGPACFALLAALIAVRSGLDAGAVAVGVTAGTIAHSVLFALGLSLLAEAAVVSTRVGRPLLQTSIR